MKKKLYLAALAATGALALPAAAQAQSPYYPIPNCESGEQNATTAPYYCIPIDKPTVKKKAKKFTLVVTPRIDKKKPIKFRAKGKLVKPSSVSKSRACRGNVRVTFKKPNGKIVKKKTVKLGKNCKYATKKITMPRKKLRRGGSGKLVVKATFLGNSRVKSKVAKIRKVRYKT